MTANSTYIKWYCELYAKIFIRKRTVHNYNDQEFWEWKYRNAKKIVPNHCACTVEWLKNIWRHVASLYPHKQQGLPCAVSMRVCLWFVLVFACCVSLAIKLTQRYNKVTFQPLHIRSLSPKNTSICPFT